MPSSFAHLFVPAALCLGLGPRRLGAPLCLAALASGQLPDLDVAAFSLGIPYGAPWGHRGALHSLAFALLWALLVSLFFRRSRAGWALAAGVLAVSTASHTLLDAMTDGGKGVALFWPVSDHRWFLPLRPIRVSPIGMDFFGARGLASFRTEIVWVGLPALTLAVVLALLARPGAALPALLRSRRNPRPPSPSRPPTRSSP